jgi:hypothetical protein
MVWRRSTRARSPPASRSLAYCSASWIAPRSSSRWPSGVVGRRERAGARSRGRRRSHLRRPWRSWRPARPPSRRAWIRQPRPGWSRTSPAHLHGWLGWRQSPSAGADLQGWLICRPKTGRRTRPTARRVSSRPHAPTCATDSLDQRSCRTTRLCRREASTHGQAEQRTRSEPAALDPESVQQFRWGSKAVAGANGLVKTHGRMGGLACPSGGAPAGWLSSLSGRSRG